MLKVISPYLPKLRNLLFVFMAGIGLGGFCVSSSRAQEQTANELQSASQTEPARSPTDPAVELDEPERGLDERIDALFRPIANVVSAIVFVETPKIGWLPPIPVVLIVLVFGAAYFTLYFRFVNLRLFGLATEVVRGKYDDVEDTDAFEVNATNLNVADGDIARTARDESQHGEVSHFQALSAALSGTVGLGNIGGVATAIIIGGPGATVWMIVCGLLGMSSKFVECTLGVCYRDIEPDGTVHGGAMYYLSKGLAGSPVSMLGKVLAFVFAVGCVGASLGGGNMYQANQTSAQLQTVLGLSGNDSALGQSSGFAIGLVLAVFVGVIIIGGIKRIATVAEKIVPLMAAIYVGASLTILAVHAEHIPEAFRAIIDGAFSLRAGMGGLIGVMIAGFRRAAFSNEAGMGSAAIAHSAVRTKYPASEGVVALLEPFVDTVVICTMTALVIVIFNADGSKFDFYDPANKVDQKVAIEGISNRIGGVDLTSVAFDSALPNFRYVLTIAVMLFAISTMISWSYYGLVSWKYLFGRGYWADMSFKMLFCFCTVIGAASSMSAVIDFSDAMMLSLAFPNMLGLVLLAPRVREELARYLKAIGKEK